jgi:hypothetical protein
MSAIFFGQNQLSQLFVTYSDNFDRANSSNPGANWAEFDQIDIASNTLRFVTPSASNTGIWKTALNGLTQWMKFTVTWLNSGNFFGPYFRLSNFTNGSQGYSLLFDEVNNLVSWYSSTLGSASTQIGGDVGLSIINGDIFGITVQGLGNNTVVRIWRLPTGFPVSSSNWDGNAIPDVTFTTNPSLARDTGLYVGVWGLPGGSSNNLSIDNWFAGTCPD